MKKNNLVLFLISLFIIIAIVVVVYNYNYSPNKPFAYKNTVFYPNSDGFFYVYYNLTNITQQIEFRLDPRQMDNIALYTNPRGKTENASEIYLTYNPNLNISYGKLMVALIEVARLIPYTTTKSISTQEALTEYSEEIGDRLPFKTCADATNETVVIVFDPVSDSNKITEEGDCIKIEATNEDNIILAADRFGYGLIGIM